MLFKKHFFLVYFLIIFSNASQAQIEVANISSKIYNAIGFGGFLTFGIPVSEANSITVEGGIQYFKDKNTDQLNLINFLAGYRYNLNQSGEGLYVEPTAGYTFSTGDYVEDQGISAGAGVGYIFDIANIPFNFGLRYLHTFDESQANVVSFRISHTLTFGRRNRD